MAPSRPGAPLATQFSNNAVVGGVGAFPGARGQLGGKLVPDAIPYRTASVTEDSANRRIHGGGKLRFVVHLIPLSRPEVVTLPSGPAIFNGDDFSQVTPGKPARAVVNKIGWPTMTNVYRVDFVVPEGTAPGTATVTVSAAWIAGPEVRIAVQ